MSSSDNSSIDMNLNTRGKKYFMARVSDSSSSSSSSSSSLTSESLSSSLDEKVDFYKDPHVANV